MKISPEQITQDIRNIVCELTGLSPEEVKDNERLREDMGLDSLQAMELISRISELYEVDPEMDEVMDLSTIEEVRDFLLNHL